jgi:hypothetical protein
MSDPAPLQGLNCPRCGGVIAIPEGAEMVACPYCELRSVVAGDRGLRQYQVACRVDRAKAVAAYQAFLSSNFAIARDLPRSARLSEAFVAYLPFWSAWGRGLGWTFGQVEHGSGDHRTYEPREQRAVQELAWNAAACDVGEFGVTQVPIDIHTLEPFKSETLHAAGMVFEPVGSADQARTSAQAAFADQLKAGMRMDKVSQLFTRIVRLRLGVVYYPLWILRYLYRGRAFQVAVDGSTGKVLYGKAPGNTLYRAGMLVGGMAAGAFLAVDAPALFLSGSGNHSCGAPIFAFLAGLGLMYAGFRAFRYGEQYEYHPGGKPAFDLDFTRQFGKDLGGVSKIIDLLD